tara:strand:+ start:73 stop:246 length:174 start_codon:yes stop_codon:yes gene_type:complete
MGWSGIIFDSFDGDCTGLEAPQALTEGAVDSLVRRLLCRVASVDFMLKAGVLEFVAH